MASSTARAVLAAACALVPGVAYAVVPDHRGAQVLTLTIAGVVAALVMAHRLHRESLLRAVPWVFLVTGSALYATSSVAWSVREGLHVGPFPSPADVGFLGAYALWCAFLVSVTFGASDADRARRTAVSFTDAGIFTCAGLAIVWPSVISVYMGDPNVTGYAAAVAIAYPVMLAFLFGLAVHVVVSGVARTAVGALLVVWVGAELGAAVPYSFISAAGDDAVGHPTSLFWFVSYGALVALAAHPKMLSIGSLRLTPQVKSRWRDWLLLAGPLTPLLVWFPSVDPGTENVGSTELGLLVLALSGFLLLFARLKLVSGDLVRERQVTDELEASASMLREQRDALEIFAAVVEATNEAVIVTSVDGTIQQWNPGAENLYGYSAAESVGRSLGQLYGPKAMSAFIEFTRAAISTGAATVETSVPRRDGTEIEVAGTLSAIRDGKGHVTQLVGISRDVTEAARLRDALERTALELRAGQRLAGAGSWQWDVVTDTVTWSEETYRLFGIDSSKPDMTYAAFLERVHEDDRQMVRDGVTKIFRGVDEFRFDHRVVRPGGQVAWLSSTGGVVRDPMGKPLRVIGHTIDVTRSKLAEQELREQRDRLAVYAEIVEWADDAIVVTSMEGTILSWNPGAERLYGYTAGEMVGRPASLLLPPEELFRFPEILRELSNGPPQRNEVQNLRKDGSRVLTSVTVSHVHGVDGRRTAVVGIARDISEQKRALERERELGRELEHLAFHDPLTGLANRALLKDRLAHALVTRREAPVSVLLLDLDDFKSINDVSGHAAGDQLLIEVAARLLTCVRAEDTVARLGGDEFAVVVEDGDAEKVAQRILEELSRPAIVAGRSVVPTGSIGIASSGAAAEPGTLMLHADIAMYAAKASGRARWKMFDPTMAELATRRAHLQDELRQAVSRNEIVVHYQAIMEVETQAVSRFEALVRWQTSEGLVAPSSFLPLAEETSLIVEIEREVLRQACVQLHRWLSEDERRSVAVNVSAWQLSDDAFVEDVQGVLAAHGVPLSQLVLEVTESLFFDATPAVIDRLATLRSLGARVSIDDFGTGYSSLGRLQALPVDSMKIDKSFVELIRTGDEDLPILTSMVLMSHSLGLDVTAEGVETHQQATRLLALGCEYLQGYHFAAPQPPGSALTSGAQVAGAALGTIVGSFVGGSVVLLIEDDAALRTVARTALSSAGFKVQEASSGSDGLSVADQLAPDCIVVELGLPDMQGLEVVRALRSRTALDATAIVVFAGAAQRPLKAGAFLAGADDFIVKPITPSHLSARVREAIVATRGASGTPRASGRAAR